MADSSDSQSSGSLDKPPYCRLTLPREKPTAVLSLKSAGDMSSPVVRNNFLQALGIEACRPILLKQVHSQRVHVIEEIPEETVSSPRPPVEGDGSVTEDPRVVLCATVADCLPIFLIDEVSGAFGLLHSGWRGTGIAEVAVRLMISRFRSHPRNIRALFGPFIGPCCYRVPEERYRFFTRRFGNSCGRTEDGGFFLDLEEANRNILTNLGVEDIRSSAFCTSCHSSLSSFRRDGKEFTLMLAVIGHFLRGKDD
jgi:YfiH family protein